VDFVLENEFIAFDRASFVEDVGMEESVVATGGDERFAHIEVVGLGDRDAALVVAEWAVEVVAGLERGDGIQHGEVGDVAGIVLQQEIESGQIGVEFGQAVGVDRTAVG
jgi:hypothetical protein